MSDAQVSLSSRIRELGTARPDDVAYRQVRRDSSDEACTWGWLHHRSSQLAGALAARGLGQGDHLGLGLGNSPQFVIAVFAAWKLGAVPVPIRWDVPDWELARLREVIEARVYLDTDDVPWIDASAELEAPELPDVLSPHSHGICSSGSTGTPKVILADMPSVHGLVGATLLADKWRKIPRPQNIAVLAPMYHVNAFTTLYFMLVGDQLAAFEKFDAAGVVDAIERHRITNFTATPTMLQRIADLPGIETRDLSSIEWITQGAAPMPPSLVHRWAKLVGPERLVMAYGSTEGFGTTALTAEEWMTREGSVGRGVGATEIRVLDTEQQDLPPGEIGEVYLRSSRTPGSRYLGNVAQPASTEDGFHSVGDLGYLDADGFLYLVDRRVDLIITGGANVFPAEVEAAVIDHPKVADVVVIGLQDAEWGRRVHAIVEPADPQDPPTFEEIRTFAKGRLAPYKVPKSLEVVDAIPRSEATKVNRGRLVEARGG